MFELLLQRPQSLLGRSNVKSGVIGCSVAKKLLLVRARVGAELRCFAVGRGCRTDPTEAVRDSANFNIPGSRISISPFNIASQCRWPDCLKRVYRLSIGLKQHFLFSARYRLIYPQLFPKKTFSASSCQL
jgi:hypothetical protein